MIDLFVILTIGVFLNNARVSKFHEDYLLKEQMVCIKGMCSIVIMMHHIAQKVTGGILFSFFTYSGFLFLGIFFFISGYGLMLQYQKRKQEYLKSYWSGRIIKVLLPYLLANVVYYIAFAINGITFSCKEMIFKICSGQTIGFMWYIVCIILLYILFWCACKIAKDNKKLFMSIIYIGCIGYCIACICLKTQFTRYIAVAAFVLGISYSERKNHIEKFLSSNYYLKMGAMVLLSAILAVLCRIVPNVWIGAILGNIAVVVFCICSLGFFMRCQCINCMLTYVGNVSLELYLYHGLFVLLLPKDNNFIYTLFVMILSVMTAGLAKKISDMIFIKRRV